MAVFFVPVISSSSLFLSFLNLKLLLFFIFQLSLNKIRQHEDNIKFLNSQSNRLAESILDLQGMFRSQSFFILVLFLFYTCFVPGGGW